MKQLTKSGTLITILSTVLIAVVAITLSSLYIQKSDNCYMYIETDFLKILLHGKGCN